MKTHFMTMLQKKWAAVAVHILTALGTLCGLYALYYAGQHVWQAAFAWLGIALIIDGLDGPLARRVDMAKALPRFSGERLDLIIDYLNYVIVPAVIILESGVVPEGLRMVSASLIALSSLFHFSDRESKTKDGYFVGFPAIWNIAVFYLFAFALPQIIAFMFILLLSVLVFIPMKWVHPLRVHKLRPITIAIVGGWTIAAILTIRDGFPADTLSLLIFAFAAVYFIAIGASRTFAAKSVSR